MPLLMFSDKGVDWSADTIKAMLVGSHTWTMAEEFVDDIVASEVSGTGYSRQTLGSKTETRAYPYVTYDAADVTFSSITASGIEYIVFFKDTGSDATSPLIAFFDLKGGGSAKTVVNDDAVFTLSANGLFQEEYR